MSLLADMRRPSRYPDAGLSLSDLLAALEVIAENPDIRDKRVLGLSLNHNGVLFVKTGQSIGGYEVALQKVEGFWQIAECEQWIS